MKKQKILEQLNKMEAEHIRQLRPHPFIKDYHTTSFPVKNYLYLMFLIGDIIKVSILALEAGDMHNDRQIKEPQRSVSDVLRHALDLIPIEEQEFIDKTKSLLDELNGECDE